MQTDVKRKFPHLDGLRGLAALAIVGTHSLIPGVAPSGGPLWVRLVVGLRLALPFFFLLSAFLLYRPFVAARFGDSTRPALGSFWWRRILRIVPAYWVALTLTAVWPGVHGVLSAHAWRYYTFVYVYSAHTVAGGLVPAWTLCVDMTFYLALPLFALAMDRLWRRRGSVSGSASAELWVLLVIGLLSTVYWFTFAGQPHLSLQSADVRRWNLAANLNWFVLGMGLAVVSVTDRTGPSWLTRALNWRYGADLAWACGILVFGFTTVDYFSLSPAVQHLLAGFACLCIFAPAVIAGRRGGIQSLLAHRRVMWLGLISYGVYLYHPAVLGTIGRLGAFVGSGGLRTYVGILVVALPCSLVFGVASYHLLERPILRYRRRASVPLGHPASVVPDVAPTESLAGSGTIDLA